LRGAYTRLLLGKQSAPVAGEVIGAHSPSLPPDLARGALDEHGGIAEALAALMPGQERRIMGDAKAIGLDGNIDAHLGGDQPVAICRMKIEQQVLQPWQTPLIRTKTVKLTGLSASGNNPW
jgi:hypothetical protein